MTSYCRIYLFGTLQLYPAGHTVPLDIRSAKLRPLLGYLILHHGRAVERQRMADFLWPESDEAAGRRNLREYLYRARQALDEFAAGEELLVTDDRFATLTLPQNCWVDLFEFQDKLAQAHETTNHQQKIELLEAAQALYRDDLLRDFYEDWADSEREQVRHQVEASYAQLANLYKTAGDYPTALKAAQQAVSFDPLREEHHRRLMELYALSGDRAQALQQYKQLKERLNRELGIEPMAETSDLADAIISGAYKLQAVAPSAPPTAAPLVSHTYFTNFVGRQAELARLNLLLEQRPQNTTDTVVIRGDSGVGKTRLVGHWLSQLPPQTIILQGRGHEFEASIPYRPLLDAIQRVLPQVPWQTLPAAAAHTWLAPLAQLLPELYFHLPDLPPAAPSTEIETSYVMEGLTQIMLSLARQGLASQRPLVLFIDDIHWADMATWRFLSFLSRRVEGRALLMVCTFSSSESTAEARNRLWALDRAGRTQILQLARLWPNDTAQMVAQTLAADVQEVNSFTQKLHQMTDGNPFFATEIMRTLTESDLPKPYTAASLDQLTLPDAIQTLIETRLDRLGRESHQLLSMAAAVRREFTFDFLVDIVAHVDEDTLLEYLEEWLERGLIVEQPSGYDFAHQQIRTVAYTVLSRPRRQRVHRQIALALTQREPNDVERIGRHYALSDQPVRAIPYLLEAGQRALNVRSYQEAELIGQTLLEILEHTAATTPSAAPLTHQLHLASAHSFMGHTQQALTVLKEAAVLAEQADDPAVAGETLLRIAQIHWLRGEAREARPYAERAHTLLTPLQKTQPENYGAMLRLLGRINIAQGRFAAAKPYLYDALAQLDDHVENRLNRLTMLGYLVTAHGHLREEKETRAVIAQIDQLATEVESPAVFAVVRTQIAVALNALDRWAEAEPIAKRGLQNCEEHHLPVYAFVAKAVLGRVAFYLGRQAEAYQWLHEAITWAEAHNYLLFRYMAHVYLAEIAQKCEDATTFAEQIKTAAQLAEQTDNQWAREQVAKLRP